MPRDCEGLDRPTRSAEKSEILRVTEVKTESGYMARCLVPAWDPTDQRLVSVPMGADVFVLSIPGEWDGEKVALYDMSATSPYHPFLEGLTFKDRGHVSLQEIPVETRLLIRT